jgi:hypothetical protein
VSTTGAESQRKSEKIEKDKKVGRQIIFQQESEQKYFLPTASFRQVMSGIGRFGLGKARTPN